MRSKKLSALFFIVAGLLVPCSGHAQRMVPGQWSFVFGGNGWYNVPLGDCRNPTNYGGEVSFGRVNYGSKLIVRAVGNSSVLRDYRIADNMEAGWSALRTDLRFIDLYASYGYLFNLAHSRSYGVNLWGGGTVDAGARLRRPLDGGGQPVYGYPAASFFPGISPELNLEMFFSARASLSLLLRGHMQWPVVLKMYSENTKEPWFFPQAGLQFNFYFFADR